MANNHLFLKFIVIVAIVLFAMYYFVPASFNQLMTKAKTTDFIKNGTYIPTSPRMNYTLINGTYYYTIGKIKEERACVNEIECNDKLPDCLGRCICTESVCLRTP